MIVTGDAEINKRILNIIRATPDEVGDAMIADADMILVEAVRRTPLEFGPLRESARRGEAETNGHMIAVPISFDTPYAVYVHENLEARHPIGQAKFLESALLEAAPGAASRIGKRINLERMSR